MHLDSKKRRFFVTLLFAASDARRYVYKEHTKGDGGIIIYHPLELINIKFLRPL